MEQTECSEKLAYKIQTSENYPEENIQQNSCFCLVEQLNRSKVFVGRARLLSLNFVPAVEIIKIF